jgi:hypothetical protein
MTNAEGRAIFTAERRILPMEKSTIGKGALVLAMLLCIAAGLSLLEARTTPAEAKALADLRRIGCNAQALTFDAQLACARIQPESGFVVARMGVAGFFGLATLITLGFGLAMLARPNVDKLPDMGRTEERERQRRLALAAQAKMREEEAKRDGTS